MMRISFWLLLIAGVCVTFTIRSADGQQVMLHGEVKDTLGARITSAHVLLRADKAGGFGKGNIDRNLFTDAGGHFEATVGQGFYDLCVMADAFSPQCKKIFVDRSTHIYQHFKLKVDPEVEKHIGDTFQ